jgi:kynurenine--oxoglutarate transaminase/cysteine-S-conjugate beta-lyase/glutamine--phenylpyruvate transaminase
MQLALRPKWLEGIGTSVFAEFSALAIKTKAVNLGQGFPSWKPPKFVLDSLASTTNENSANVHQYARPLGHLKLVNALSKLYSPLIKRDLDPLTQIQITNGASGGLFVTLLSLLDPGDEVIIFSPIFDIYEGAVRRAEGKIIEVPLFQTHTNDSSGWTFSIETFKNAITPKTKAILINTPHNPTGKLFTREELENIAEVVRQNSRIVVITDEVYEFMIYDNLPFTRFCTLEGMWDRTLTISSAGKLFSATGWKIGWTYGPQHLMESVALCAQFAWFSVNTPSQEAIASSLEIAMSSNYFQDFLQEYTARRTLIMTILKDSGFNPVLPQSGFFCLVNLDNLKNIKNIANKTKASDGKSLAELDFDKPMDWNFCRWLTAEVGVTAIPCSAFYFGNPNAPTNMIRFAFCKTNAELEQARVFLKDAIKNNDLE